MNSRSLLGGVAASLTCLFLAAGASAASLTEVRATSPNERSVVRVSIDDLNLASPSGQKVLYSRISAAAEKACGSSDLRMAGSLTQAARNADCQQASVSRALARVNQGAVATR